MTTSLKASCARSSVVRGVPQLARRVSARRVVSVKAQAQVDTGAKKATLASTVAGAAFQVSQSLPALAYAGGDPLVNPNTGSNGPLGLLATILFVFIPTAFLLIVYLKDPGTEKDRFGK